MRQFLAAGTVIVYAGAIIVTFLFVIMLAQMEGKAAVRPRRPRPGRATFTCFLLFWCLIYALGPLIPSARGSRIRTLSETPRGTGPWHETSPRTINSSRTSCRGDVLAVRSRARPRRCATPTGIEKPTSPDLATRFTTDHLVTVGLAGALLFVALIGPWRSPIPGGPIRPGDTVGAAPTEYLIRPRYPVPSTTTTCRFQYSSRSSHDRRLHARCALRNYLLVGAALFVLGMLGFLSRRTSS